MDIRPLSTALQKKAEEELNETPTRIKTDVQTLRDWLSQQPHLQSINPSDQWLVAFLRGSKYNIEKAKGKIDMYYIFKATVPEFYANRDPLDPGIQELLKLGLILPLRKCLPEDSPRIVINRLGTFSHTSRPLLDLVKLALMMIEILLLDDDNFTIAGEDALADCKDLSFGVLWYWTPSLARKISSCAEKALSLRLKSMHIMNGPFFMGPAVKLFRMFLGAKIKDRFLWHDKDCDTLYDHINKSLLPEEYGGTNGTLQELIDYWKAKVESHRDWFLDESCSDESKRPKKTNSGIFSSMMRPFQSSDIEQ